jgi:CRP-like cAMP-binding protein
VLIPLHRARAGEFFAEASLFADAYHCDGEVMARSEIAVFEKAAVLNLMATDGPFAQAFCKHLAGQVQRLRSGIELRAIRSAPQRVMAALSFKLPDGAREMELSGTWKDFALDIGLTHEALYRALKSLQDAGRLHRSGRRFRMGKSD